MNEAIEIVETIMTYYLGKDEIPKSDLDIAMRVLMNVRKILMQERDGMRAEVELHKHDAVDTLY